MDYNTMSPGSCSTLLDRLSVKIEQNSSTKRALFASPLGNTNEKPAKKKGLRKQHSNGTKSTSDKPTRQKSNRKRRKKPLKQSQSMIVATKKGRCQF